MNNIASNALINIREIMSRDLAENDFFAAQKAIQQTIWQLKESALNFGGISAETLKIAFEIINDPKNKVNRAIGADATEAVRPPETRYWDIFDRIDFIYDDWANNGRKCIKNAKDMDEKIDILWNAIWWFIDDISVVDANEFKYWRKKLLALVKITFNK